MPPLIRKGDHIPGDFGFFQKHLEHAMSEEALQSPAIDPMCDVEHAAFVEVSIRNEHMQVGIEPQKIPECLNGDGGAGYCG